jgi:heterodisulfide reductase subunit A
MNRDVLILGGGIAGIQAALLLAEKDHSVYVMDSAPAIGGFFPLLERTFPTNSCGICFMSPKPPAYCPIYENAFHQNITVLTDCDIKALRGEPGNFTVAYDSRARYVDPGKCTLCLDCAEACPVEVARELGGGLEKRKAIYLPFMQAIPRSFAIDMSACTRCGKCLDVCRPRAIDFDQKTRTAELQVGAVVLGFGFEPNPASIKGEYGFGRYTNVFSSIQYERMLSFSGPTQGLPVRLGDGRKIKKLAFRAIAAGVRRALHQKRRVDDQGAPADKEPAHHLRIRWRRAGKRGVRRGGSIRGFYSPRQHQENRRVARGGLE